MTSLPPELNAAIARFVQHDRILVASDFDGVLAPIVMDPSASAAQPGTLEALRELARLNGVHVAIASGRDLATLRRLTGLRPQDDVVLIGSHGAESSCALDSGTTSVEELTEDEQEALDDAREALEAVVERVPAGRIEHKPAGVVLHTRGLAADDAHEATASALRIPQDVPGVQAMRGKSVVELSVLDVSKGAALRALAVQVGARATAYLGDDVTDETAFSVLPVDEGHLTVKVGKGDTAAEFRLRDCTEVPTLLDALVAARGRVE